MTEATKTLIINSISILMGTIGIVLAMLSYYKSRRLRRLTYSITSNTIVSNTIQQCDDIEVRYKGDTVNNLTATTIEIYNSGTETLEASSFVAMAPLSMILTNGTKILALTYATSNEAMSDFTIRWSESPIPISISYLEPNSSIRISFLHTGESSDIAIMGRLKGGGTIKRQRAIDPTEHLRNGVQSSLRAACILTAVGAILSATATDKRIVAVFTVALIVSTITRELVGYFLRKSNRSQL